MKRNFDFIAQVREFHEMFNHPVVPEPQIPDAKRCELRVELLREELKELQEAIDKNDLNGVADAFCDLQYVLSGAILEFGMGEKFAELFSEVHRSNMSKACATLEDAEKTTEHYFQKVGTASHITQKGDAFLVYRSSDNKILKSINYSPANLKSILYGK